MPDGAFIAKCVRKPTAPGGLDPQRPIRVRQSEPEDRRKAVINTREGCHSDPRFNAAALNTL